MKPARIVAVSLLAGVLCGASPLLAQEQPLVAGADGVPVPKRTKVVKPSYPAEALAQGLRGIVILDLLIDAQGKVVSTSVVRSVPGLDEAAVAAARQWEYEPTKVGGKPVSVRLTVPITFTLALPTLARDSGIPELRQGVSPAYPAGASDSGSVTAEVTLEGDGRVGTARIVEGNEPWAGALLAALQTWRFSPPPEDASVSFRVQAQFAAARGGEPARVALKASGLQRSDEPPAAAASTEAPASAAAPSTSTPPSTTAPASSTPDSPAAPPAAAPRTAVAQAQDAPPATPPAGAPTGPRSVPDTPQPQSPVPTPGSPGGVTPDATPPAGAPPVAAPPAPPGANPPGVDTPAGHGPVGRAPGGRGTSIPPATTADHSAPPVEVITAPPPQQPPENGVSAIRDVTLSPGVPDLTRGRRPVAPPLARMAGATGIVEVAFSVSAAGSTMVQSVNGPDLLKKAAEQTVASWVFRRTRADRAYLTATFNFAADRTDAAVKPQPVPPAGAASAPDPTAVPAASAAPASAVAARPAPATPAQAPAPHQPAQQPKP